MKPDLIVIANASHARLFSRDTATAVLVALHTVQRPEGGCAGEPPGVQPNPDGPPLDPRRRRLRLFAGVVAQRIEAELASKRFARLALFAACPFLGEVMRQLSRPTKDQAMKAVVDADISDLEWSELAQRVERELLAAAQEAARAGRGRRGALHDGPAPA